MASELERILDAVLDWSDRDLEFGLATVVGTRGSTYRGLGARQLIGPEGAGVGTVSGGCLDRDLQAVAAKVIDSGEPQVVEFDLTADDEAIWGWGIGCNGATRLLVEPAGSALDFAKRMRSGRPRAVIHVLGGPRLGEHVFVSGNGSPSGLPSEVEAAAGEAIEAGRHRTLEAGGVGYMVEVLGPPPRLVVFGAGHDAAPLVRLGAQSGMAVTVVDERRQFLTEERFPEAEALVHADPGEAASLIRPDRHTYAVLMTHNYLRDLAYLRSLLCTDVAYIGMLGPGERLGRLLADLESEGVRLDREDLAKLHGPAGLDLGAEGPAEIALAIMAEVLAVSRAKEAGFLRRRKGPEELKSLDS